MWKTRPQGSSIFSGEGKAECQWSLWQDKAEQAGADDPGAWCHCPLMAHPRQVQGSHRPWTSLGWVHMDARSWSGSGPKKSGGCHCEALRKQRPLSLWITSPFHTRLKLTLNFIFIFSCTHSMISRFPVRAHIFRQVMQVNKKVVCFMKSVNTWHSVLERQCWEFKSSDSAGNLLADKSWLCYPLTVGLEASCLTSISPSFLI